MFLGLRINSPGAVTAEETDSMDMLASAGPTQLTAASDRPQQAAAHGEGPSREAHHVTRMPAATGSGAPSFPGIQPGFLLPPAQRGNFYPDGRRDRRKRRNRKQAVEQEPPQHRCVLALSAVVSGSTVTGEERLALLLTAKHVVWDEKAKAGVYLRFVQRPDRAAEEDAFYEWGFGTPSESSLSGYEYSEPPPPAEPSREPCSVQGMRAACRKEFLAWWARRLEKERRTGKPVLRSYPQGPPEDEAVFFDTHGAGQAVSSWQSL